MTLAVVETVRNALRNGEALRQSDVVALLSLASQLWEQTQRRYQTTADRREYMRLYMRRYRAKARVKALRARQSDQP